jgi:hypothetical protein
LISEQSIHTHGGWHEAMSIKKGKIYVASLQVLIKEFNQ